MSINTKADSEADILARLSGTRKDAPLGTIWHHVESGHLYKVTGHTVDESDLSVRIIYARVGGETPIPWGRKADNFLDVRFVKQD